MRSTFYEGHAFHRRLEPVEHSFSYPVLIPLLDLSELPGLFDSHRLWSARRPAPVRLRARDLLGRGAVAPSEAARTLVAERTGLALPAPIRVLTHPRYFGVGFNPIRVYFLGTDGDGPADAAIAEVTNTPWGERQSYVFAREPGVTDIRGRAPKRLRVSPFMAMEQTYEVRIGQPGERLEIELRNLEAGRTVFEAGLTLRRAGFSRALLTRALLSHPPQTIATLVRIYAQAVGLRRKGLRPVSAGS